MTNHLRERPGDQPLPSPGRECVQDRLIAEIEARKQLGVARYGSPLMTHNGRDALQDAWEESIDLAAYLTQMRMERADATVERAQAATGTLPHGGFALHTSQNTASPDGNPTVYVICSCGRGYAFGRRADSADLFGFLADHDGFVRAESASPEHAE